MKTAILSSKPYDQYFFDKINAQRDPLLQHELFYFDSHLNEETIFLIKDFPCICAFVNDSLTSSVIQQLKTNGIQLIALRSAGFNHVDLKAAHEVGIPVVRVPAYSPHAVAEYTIGLMLTLNRKIHRAYNRVREGNFSLHGLMGFDLYEKTVGIIGTGKIGGIVAKILNSFGCHVLAYDIYPDESLEKAGIHYVDKKTLLQSSDIISFHCPLVPKTHHFICETDLEQLKDQVMIINTSRGAVLDTKAIIQGLKSQKIGALGLDVYEEEEPLFFEDFSDTVIQDDIFSRLLTFPNVLITGHQAFFTHEAMHAIAQVTLDNISAFEQKKPLVNQVFFKN